MLRANNTLYILLRFLLIKYINDRERHSRRFLLYIRDVLFCLDT